MRVDEGPQPTPDPGPSEPGPETPSRGSRRNGWIPFVLECLIGLPTLAGVILWLTARDSVPGLSLLFYATPLSLLLLGACCCAICSLRQGHRWRAGVWGVLWLMLLPSWLRHDWAWNQTSAVLADDPETVSVLFWNVARKEDLQPAADYLRRVNADIIAMVEMMGEKNQRRAFWQEQLPGYDVAILGGGLCLLTKGTSGDATVGKLGRGSIYRQLKVTVRGNDFSCFVVDIDAYVLRSRQAALERLGDVVAEFLDENVVIMGDFNTPPGSVHLARLRAHHRQLFEVSGNGFAPTWPVPVPVLQLDQIWVNSNVQPLTCRHGFSTASDHRPVLATLRPVRRDRAKPLPAE